MQAHHLRLPDAAQTRPTPEVAVQPDFYYQRAGLPGVCVFIDGLPRHSLHKRHSDILAWQFGETYSRRNNREREKC